VFVADLTVQAEVDALRDFLLDVGDIHALVNNAGGAIGLETVEDGDPDDWLRMFDINVMTVKRVTSALLPLLRKAALDAGSADILTVTSIAGHVTYELGGGYAAAKHAAAAVVGVLRLELAGEPIRVIEVAPGMVHTEEFSLVRFGGDQDRADAVYDNIEPLTAEDVAESIVHALELPGHVNLDLVTIKPVAQAATHKVVRGPLVPKQSA
jgi:NADP-dependent 3-hydroxy acid dehydrogenase YdfG